MNCTICGRPIILSPSAAERARKYGGRPEDYTNAFTTHAQCAIAKRSQESDELMRRLNQKENL